MHICATYGPRTSSSEYWHFAVGTEMLRLSLGAAVYSMNTLQGLEYCSYLLLTRAVEITESLYERKSLIYQKFLCFHRVETDLCASSVCIGFRYSGDVI
jgi:hypothetical protein